MSLTPLPPGFHPASSNDDDEDEDNSNEADWVVPLISVWKNALEDVDNAL